jgi:hypothetical protein
MADFIDLMGFARGARLANDDNWRDAFNQLKMDDMQTAAAQQQELYNLKLPELQAATADRMAERLANRDVAKLEAMLSKEALGVPPEGIGGLYAARVNEAMLNAGEDPARLRAIKTFGARKVASLVGAGDLQGARALSTAMGGEYTQKIEAIETWRDPRNWSNPEAVAAAGGTVRADGKVEMVGLPGVAVTPEQFAKMQLDKARSALYDPTKMVAGARNTQEQEAMLLKDIDRFNAERAKDGIPVRAIRSVGGGVQYVPVQAVAADGSSMTPVAPVAPAALAPLVPDSVQAARRTENAMPAFTAPTLTLPPEATASEISTAGFSPQELVAHAKALRQTAQLQLQRFTPELQAANPQGYVRARQAFIDAIAREQRATERF